MANNETEDETIAFGQAVTIYKKCTKAIESIDTSAFKKYGKYHDFFKAKQIILKRKNNEIFEDYAHLTAPNPEHLLAAAFDELNSVATEISRNGMLPDKIDQMLSDFRVAEIADGDIEIREPDIIQTFKEFFTSEKNLVHIEDSFLAQFNMEFPNSEKKLSLKETIAYQPSMKAALKNIWRMKPS